MTKSDWLTVAMVAAVIMSAIATLLGPVLAVYIQSRISNKHRPQPVPKQPGNAFQRFWRFLDLSRYWTSFAGMLFSAAMCSIGFRRARHVADRYSVALIAFGISIYTVCFVGFAMYKNLDALWGAIDEIDQALDEMNRSSKPLAKRKR